MLHWILASVLFMRFPCPQSEDRAGSRKFVVEYSEKLDAAAFLNAFSENPRFNSPWTEVRKAWTAKFDQDQDAKAALQAWAGRGIQLAYLLSAIPESTLEATIRRFEDPDSLLREIEQGLDEPAYQPDFRRLKDSPKLVETLLSFFHKNGFLEWRAEKYEATLAGVRKGLEENLKKVNAERFLAMLESFTGRRAPDRKLRIYVLAFSYPFSFQLSGFAVGWSTDKGAFAWLLAHEFLHKFNPTKKNRESQQALANGDAFYKEAWDRVYGDYGEGKEEEFVEAAAQYMIHELGLSSKVRCLRAMKFMYFSDATHRGGVPLAAIVYDELIRSKINLSRFDYNSFLTDLFESGRVAAGNIEARYREAIRPVSGSVGIKISGSKVERVFPGMAAERAGVKVGDILVRVNAQGIEGKDQEEILDLLAGEPGTPIELSLMRDGKPQSVSLKLQ